MTSARFTLPPTTGLVFQPVVATDDDSWTVDDARLLGRQRSAQWLLDQYQAHPDDPLFADSNPLLTTYIAVNLADSAPSITVELTIHPREPGLEQMDQWDRIEQAGGEFGRYGPVSLSSYGWTDSHVVAPVLAAIADGWNMVRVSCRDRRPSAESTVLRIDIWPIEGPIGRQVIKQAPQGAARPSPARLEVPDGPGTSDAVGVTLGAQTLPTPPPDRATPTPRHDAHAESVGRLHEPAAAPSGPPSWGRGARPSIPEVARRLRAALVGLSVTDNPLIGIDLDALDTGQIRMAAPDIDLLIATADWFALVAAAHSGPRWSNLIPGFDVLRIEEALEVRTRSLKAWQPQPGSYSATAGASAYTFIPEYLPIAERDATMLVVDLRTSNRRGLIRQFDKVDNDDETPTWNDLTTLLDELIDALTHRTTFLGWQPTTQAGRLTWNLARQHHRWS